MTEPRKNARMLRNRLPESFTALPVGAIRVFTQRYPGLHDERCTLDAPPWADLGSPLRGWVLDPIVSCVVRSGLLPRNTLYCRLLPAEVRPGASLTSEPRRRSLRRPFRNTPASGHCCSPATACATTWPIDNAIRASAVQYSSTCEALATD